MRELLLFQVGRLHYGIGLSLVKGIESAKPVAEASTEARSRFNLNVDGQQMPQYDLCSIFEGTAASRDRENEKLIVVEAQEYTMGLIVSRVNQVIPSDPESVQPLSPIFGGSALACFAGVIKHDDTLLLLLKPEGITQIVQQTAKAQNFDEAADGTDNFHKIEEIITATKEVSSISDQGSMFPGGGETPDPDIYQSNQAAVDDERIAQVEEIQINEAQDFDETADRPEDSPGNEEAITVTGENPDMADHSLMTADGGRTTKADIDQPNPAAADDESVAQVEEIQINEAQDFDETADRPEDSPGNEEAITVTGENPDMADHSLMAADGGRTTEADIDQPNPAAADDERLAQVEAVLELDMGPAILGESGADGEFLSQSASLPTYHLHADRDASQLAEAPVSQTAGSAETEKTGTAADTKEKSEVPVEELSNQPLADFGGVERIVAEMLSESQLAKKVEQATIKALEKSKLAESVRGILRQAMEGLLQPAGKRQKTPGKKRHPKDLSAGV